MTRHGRQNAPAVSVHHTEDMFQRTGRTPPDPQTRPRVPRRSERQSRAPSQGLDLDVSIPEEEASPGSPAERGTEPSTLRGIDGTWPHWEDSVAVETGWFPLQCDVFGV